MSNLIIYGGLSIAALFFGKKLVQRNKIINKVAASLESAEIKSDDAASQEGNTTDTAAAESYRFYPNYTFDENNIKRATALPGKLKEMCDLDDKCMGFDTLGWLKKEIIPRDKWLPLAPGDSQAGLYINIKRNPVIGSTIKN